MNRYELEVKARCPVAPEVTDTYQVAIEKNSMIPVERLIEVIAEETAEPIFQENLTHRLYIRLSAIRVTSFGEHSGVKVTSIAP